MCASCALALDGVDDGERCISLDTLSYRKTSCIPHTCYTGMSNTSLYVYYVLSANAMWIIIIVPCTSKHTLMNNRHLHVRWSHSHHSTLVRIRYAHTTCQIIVTPPPKVGWSPRDTQLCISNVVEMIAPLAVNILDAGPETPSYRHLINMRLKCSSMQCHMHYDDPNLDLTKLTSTLKYTLWWM